MSHFAGHNQWLLALLASFFDSKSNIEASLY